jgi:hypothetical protein
VPGVQKRFIQVGNIEVFLEAITNASTCNKVLRKQFLIPDTVSMTPTVGQLMNMLHFVRDQQTKYILAQNNVMVYVTAAFGSTEFVDPPPAASNLIHKAKSLMNSRLY